MNVIHADSGDLDQRQKRTAQYAKESGKIVIIKCFLRKLLFCFFDIGAALKGIC